VPGCVDRCEGDEVGEGGDGVGVGYVLCVYFYDLFSFSGCPRTYKTETFRLLVFGKEEPKKLGVSLAV